MDRAVLLALLGIPILVIIHVALFWQPISSGGLMASNAQSPERVRLQGHWQTPEEALPANFVIERKMERGS